jgi:hypothetical protein
MLSLPSCPPTRQTSPPDDYDRPLSRAEAAARAARFSELLGVEITAEAVLAADADWLARYGRCEFCPATDDAGCCVCGRGDHD